MVNAMLKGNSDTGIRTTRLFAGSRVALFVATVLVMSVARADTFVWKEGGSTAFAGGDWRKTTNWTDADGNAVTRTPTAGDDIRFPTTATPGTLYQVVAYMATLANGLGKVTGGERFQIQLYNERAYDVGTARRRIIEDPNDFTGLWHVSESYLELLFTNSVSFTPRLAKLTSQARPIINVTNAEARVKIGLLQGRNDYTAFGDTTFARRGGTLEKIGPGTLEIEEAAGQDEFIYLKQGTISLDGRPSPSVRTEDILRRAWLRLDASNAATLMTRIGDDGRTYVTNWADANGSGRSAHRDTMKNVPTWGGYIDCMSDPFVSPVTSGTGLPLVDFGAATTSTEATLGPRNGLLRFDECKNVRELFIVRWRTDGSAHYSSIIGHHEKYPLHAGGNNYIFDGNSDLGVRAGVIRVNGVTGYWGTHPADECSAGYGSMFLLNVAPTNAIALDLLGSDRYISLRTGGCRIAEVLVFTETLTAAERAQVNEYLMDKWFKEYVPCDLGGALMNADTVLDVPDGRIARIHRLNVRGKKMIKSGGGALIVDELTPAGVPFEIRGGTVSARTLASKTVTDDAPAANPFVWLDATSASTLAFSNDVTTSKAHLTNWTDRAGGTVSAAIPWSSANFVNHFPTVKKDIPSSGLAVVDFGNTDTGTSGTGSWMWLTTRGDIAYEGFMVARATMRQFGNLFGTSKTFFIRNDYSDTNKILAPGYAGNSAAAAHWFRNGIVEDPFALGKKFAVNGAFDVVSFTSASKEAADLLARDRLDTSVAQGVGAQQIGEFILYNRRLTDVERRSTEAYLMKKWLKTVHPAKDAIADYAFADDEDRVFISDHDVTVTNVTGGTSRYVKLGSGTLRLLQTVATSAGTNGACSFTVGNGGLAVSYDYPVPMLFRFDASADSFPDTYEEAGLTYVRRWNDADGRDLYAQAYRNSKSVTNATLRTTEVRTGVSRRYVNFGAVSTATSSAGMKFSASKTNVREAFAVESDKETSQSLLTALNVHNYLRSWNPYRGLIHNFSASTTGYAYNGHIAVDGTARSPSYVPSSDFHVFNFAPTANTTIDTIALDRDVTGGGLNVCEQIGYAQPLTAERREAVTRALRVKWFAEGTAPVWTNTLDAITLDAGTLTLSMTDGVVPDAVYDMNALGGNGTLVADGLIVLRDELAVSNGTLAVNAPLTLADGVAWRVVLGADGVPPALNVSDALTVGGRVTLELVGVDRQRVRSGSHVLAHAEDGCACTEASWIIAPTGCLHSRVAKIRVREGKIWLEVRPMGFAIMVH